MVTTDRTRLNEASETETETRRYSPDLVQIIGEQLEQLRVADDGSVQEDVLALREPIRRLIVEASVLGFPRTAKLGRVIHSCLGMTEQREPHVVSDALVQAFEVLHSLVGNPGGAIGVPVSAIIGLLRGVFGLEDAFLYLPLPCYRWERPLGTSASNGTTGVLASHVDANIYSSAIIDSLDRCSEEESWTVAQLASLAEDLACETDKIRPAHRLMSVLKNHRYFRNVDRLCIAGLVHGSNQLAVVDSCISQRLRAIRDDNPMPRGYSCFVNPQGSLFRMKPGVLRVFDDTQRVISSFVRQGKPPQRSIAHIADTGLKSGLCLAIGRADRVQGYLFMNSLESGWFNDVTGRFAPLLSLFSLLGTVSLDAAGFHAESGSEPLESLLPRHSIAFDREVFVKQLNETLARRSLVRTTVSLRVSELQRFLYLPCTVVKVIVELIDRFNRSEAGATGELELDLLVDGESICVRWAHCIESCDEFAQQYRDDALQCVRNEYREVPVSIHSDATSVHVRFPIEPILEGPASSTYSVAY
jgi:hypothetical protein